MRTFQLSLAAILCLCAVNSAQAERRMFIIADDGHGTTATASAYCKSHQYAEATSFRKVDRDDVTGAIPTGGSGGCVGSKCDVVAIVCTR